MDSKDFVYWLNGWLEMENPTQIGPRQTQIIKDHIALVFDKKTPTRPITPLIEPVGPAVPELPYPHRDIGWPALPMEITCSQEIVPDCDLWPMEHMTSC